MTNLVVFMAQIHCPGYLESYQIIDSRDLEKSKSALLIKPYGKVVSVSFNFKESTVLVDFMVKKTHEHKGSGDFSVIGCVESVYLSVWQ